LWRDDPYANSAYRTDAYHPVIDIDPRHNLSQDAPCVPVPPHDAAVPSLQDTLPPPRVWGQLECWPSCPRCDQVTPCCRCGQEGSGR
jgi:hypothetical protein